MKKEYMKSEYYENRELSWLGFNERILGEARDKKNPLFERLKFLSITASNLDEFFMVRVASLKDMVNAEYSKKDYSGMTPQQQLNAIHDRVHDFVSSQYSTWQRSLLPGLRQCGLQVIEEHEELNPEQAKYVDQYFVENVYPVLTPMAVDSSRPFPLIVNKTLNPGICHSTGAGRASTDHSHSACSEGRDFRDPSGGHDRQEHVPALPEL